MKAISYLIAILILHKSIKMTDFINSRYLLRYATLAYG